MGIIEREYITEDFSDNDKKIKDLSLLISNDGFSFAIFSNEKVLLALREYRFADADQMEECLSTITADQLLKLIFRKVNIGIDSKSNALVPDTLYDQRYPERYLNPETFDTAVSKEMICIDNLEVLNGKNVHCLSVKLKNQLSDYFPGATFRHRTSILIEGFGTMLKSDSVGKVFIHLNRASCQIFHFSGKKLMSSGEFEFRSPDDFLYFVLLEYQKHQLDTKTVPLYISGMLDPKSMIYDKLYRYIQFIHWSMPEKEVQLGDYKNNYLVHRDYELFSLLTCAS